MFAQRRDEDMLAMSNGAIEEGGNGAHEIRNWITATAVVPGAKAEVVSRVEAIPVWAQSSAHVSFRLG